MTIQTSVTVAGLKDVLREINQINPAARRQITKEFRKITQPVVNEAKTLMPKEPPISGWGRTWKTSSGFQMLPWNGDLATKYVGAQVSGKRPREYAGVTRDLAVLVIRWRGMTNTLFDTARKSSTPQGANMIRGLNMNTREASRTIWPAWDNKGDKVESQIRDEIDRVMAMVNRKINQGVV